MESEPGLELGLLDLADMLRRGAQNGIILTFSFSDSRANNDKIFKVT